MKKDYQILLLEEIRDQNKALFGGQKELLDLPDKVNLLVEGMDEVKGRLKTIEAAVKDTNQDVTKLDERVIQLEQAA